MNLRLNIRDTKGIFHVKMGTIKERNGMDLTETFICHTVEFQYMLSMINKKITGFGVR